MKNRPRLEFLALFLVLPLAAGSAQKVRLPGATRHSLSNGLTVVLMEYRKVPSVVVRLVVRGGSAIDPPRLPGVASMTTSLMREGTESRTSNEISEAVDFIGASLSLGAGLDYSAATMEVLAKDLDTGLGIFADLITNPSFPPEEIERERKQRMAQLEAVKEDPSDIASIVFSRTVYGPHPYGNQAGGTKASVEAITRDDLLEFYQKAFVPANGVLVAVGDFDSRSMLVNLEAAFGAWSGGEVIPSLKEKPSPLRGRQVVVVDKQDVTQTQIVIGNTGVDINHPDYVPLLVANTVFGSGFTSRLVEELRVKRSLTYGASSGFPASLAGGTFVIQTFTKNETAAEAIDVILGEITRFREEGPSEEEVKKAQNYMAGNFARSLQTPEALATRLTDIEVYGFPKDHLETYLERVRSVGLNDIRRVVREHIRADDLLFVLVAPASGTSGEVERFGRVATISLDEAVK